MKNKQKAPVVNPTTNPVPLAKLSEDELDMVTGGYSWGGFTYRGGFHCRFCNPEWDDA